MVMKKQNQGGLVNGAIDEGAKDAVGTIAC